MSADDDVLIGKIAKVAFSGFVMAMLAMITWAANTIKDEFHDVNTHLAEQDKKLEMHSNALTVIEETDKAFITSLKDSSSSIASLAQTIANQAAANAALKQRMDDNDQFLQEIQPMGVPQPSRPGRGQ